MQSSHWWKLSLMMVLLGVMVVGWTTTTIAAPGGADFLTSTYTHPHNAVALARLAVIGDDSFMRGASIALVVATLGIVIALRRK